MTKSDELDPLFILEDEGGTARPATPIDASSVELDFINVNFMRPTAVSQLGGMQVENYGPRCNFKTIDWQDVSNSCQILIHEGFIADESGEEYECDEDGEPTVDENAFKYKIKTVYPDSEGITVCDLSLN